MYMFVNYIKKVLLFIVNFVKFFVLLLYNMLDFLLMKMSIGFFYFYESDYYLSFFVYLELVFDNLCFYFGVIDLKF